MKNDIIKKIVIAILIAIAVLIALFIGKEVAIRFFGMKTPSLSKSTAMNAKKVNLPQGNKTVYKHVTNNNYIYFVMTDKVFITDENGNEKGNLSISVENPVICAAGDYVSVGDVGGNNLYLIKNTTTLKEITTQKPIKNLSLNSSGNCIVVTEGDMHKRDVILYDAKGNELFVWTSGSKLVFDAVVSENGKNVIISSLDTQKTAANSVLSFYNISKEEPIAVYDYEDEIIADLSICENYVYCVGESKMDIYSSTGNKKGEIQYTTRTLLSYAVTKSGVVMSFEESNISDKRYSIEIYNNGGKLSASHSYDYVSRKLDATNNYIVIGREGLISILDYNGREQKLINSGFDIVDLSFVGNTKKIVGFTAECAYIIGI